MIGSQDLLIALVIGVFMFGAKKLPEMARGLGESLKEFKKATAGEADPVAPTSAATTLPPPAVSPPPCSTCHRLLEAGWTHCPTCGAPAGTAQATG
jgi:sec-independent protein translocase protein TatA